MRYIDSRFTYLLTYIKESYSKTDSVEGKLQCYASHRDTVYASKWSLIRS